MLERNLVLSLPQVQIAKFVMRSCDTLAIVRRSVKVEGGLQLAECQVSLPRFSKRRPSCSAVEA